MPGPTDEFFATLATTGHLPGLASQKATIRFDIADGKRTEHLRVTIDRGDATVTEGDGPADCVISGERRLFDEMVLGRVNQMAAVLRGTLLIDGDPELLVLMRRLLPDGGDRS